MVAVGRAMRRDYIATEDLRVAVNAAIVLERPLLIKGEPGTGKTVLAHEVARALEPTLLEWHIKSTTKAQQGLYEYDAVSACATASSATSGCTTSRTTSSAASCGKPSRRRQGGAADRRDRQGRYRVPERPAAGTRPHGVPCLRDRRDHQGRHRPIVIITSNNEKELPDAFLRRCFFHYIKFPDAETMRDIVEVHFPGLKQSLLREALSQFYELREAPGLKKKPSTSEMLDWIRLLVADDLDAEDLRRDPRQTLPKLHGALLKNEQDIHLFERLAFMARRG
jgi:MoxR-like ATPase